MKTFLQFLKESKYSMRESHYSKDDLSAIKMKYKDDQEVLDLVSDYEKTDSDESYNKLKAKLGKD